jgi:sulfite exporter TauE/SafE
VIKIIFGLFILGLSFGWGPCLASCGPLLISYSAGARKNIAEGAGFYLLFSLSRVFVYLALGLGVFFLGRVFFGRILAGSLRYIVVAAGILVVLLGLLILSGQYKERGVCAILRGRLHGEKAGALVLGLITGMMPCAPLAAILSYIAAVSRDWHQAAAYAISFGIGTVISPLALLVFLTGLFPRIFKEGGFSYRLFGAVCGLVMVYLGIDMIRRGL